MKSAAARSYRQNVRAAAAEATGERILDAFIRQLRTSWFDEIRLDQVGRDAGVAVQTVIRRFGGKEGLLEAAHSHFGSAIRRRRSTPPGDADAALAATIEDYEQIGDLVLRVLAQEDRYPPLRAVADVGRAAHRQMVGGQFRPWLERLPAGEREAAQDALVVATDIYVWKLVRRDFKRSTGQLAALMRRMIAAALRQPESEIFKCRFEGGES